MMKKNDAEQIDYIIYKEERYPVTYKMDNHYTWASTWIEGREIKKWADGFDKLGAFQQLQNAIRIKEQFRL